jgi:molybdate transport repressor ModE-like protein
MSSMADRSEGLRWTGVELRHLLTLRTVVEQGSFAAAARELGYSQPAVSQQIATLERLTGSPLLKRRAGARSVALTAAGERVLRHGRAILARAQAADAELRALQTGGAGPVRLGTIPSIGARVVPQLIQRLSDTAPGVDVELVEHQHDHHLLGRLEAGALDLTFAFAPLPDGPFEATKLLEDPYVLLVARDTPPAGSTRPITLRGLAKLPLIVCSQSDTVETFCRAHGIAAQIRYRIDDNETLVGLAAAGLGAALVPRLAADPARSDVVAVELAVTPSPRIVLLARHRDREVPAAALQVEDAARDACAAIGAATLG